MAAIPQDILDRIRALEREVRTLTGRANIRPALNEITNGPVKIAEGGSLEVWAPDGTGIFGVGALWDGAYGVQIQRSDGTLAYQVGGSGEGSNMVRTFSRSGSVILMDDYYSPEFLGRPWMPIQLFPTKQQGTESTTYQYGWVGGAAAHNAVATLTLSSIAAPAGGQVRINMIPPSGGEVVVAEYDIPMRRHMGEQDHHAAAERRRVPRIRRLEHSAPGQGQRLGNRDARLQRVHPQHAHGGRGARPAMRREPPPPKRSSSSGHPPRRLTMRAPRARPLLPPGRGCTSSTTKEGVPCCPNPYPP